MKMFNYRYLSQDQLKRLNTYKYAAIDTSPLSQYVMHPFWNFVVEFFPMSVAPNVLTLAGFACTLMNAFLLSYYDYYFYASSDDMRNVTSPVPSIVWLVCAINMFLAHTLDGIDGKQARRTKATGPLGELMDHGVDSWTALFVPLYIYSLFGSCDYSFGPHRMFFIFWSVFLTFYVTHWEKYITGILYLPWSYDVSQIFLFGCSLATYAGSYKIWKSTFPLTSLPYSQAFEIILYASIFLTLPMPIYNVYLTCKSGKSKYSTFKEIIRPLAPFSLLFTASTIWAYGSHNDVLSKDPRVYFYIVGTIFSNISCRLIVCQMSSSKCELFNGLAVLFSLVALASILGPLAATAELFVLRLLALVLTIAHVHYAVCVVQQMCDHFKINALSLSKRETESSRQHLLRNSTTNLDSSTGIGDNQDSKFGEHVIISGGSKGIGKALAIQFAESGRHVTIIARNEGDLQSAKIEIEKHRLNPNVQKIRTFSLDLTTVTFPDNSSSDISNHQKELLDGILGEHERCDILVNCCGSSIPLRFEDISQEQFNYMMQVNFFSAVNLTRLVLPVMKARNLAKQNSGLGRDTNCRIVFVSSMCGLISFFGYSAYSASKFALVGLAEALAMELKPFDIGVTISFPPDTDTPGFEEENKIKPSLTSEISKSSSVYSAIDVAQSIIRDIRARRFYSTIGLENWLVVMATNSFMPSSFGQVLFESLLAGPLKLIAFFIVKSWYSLVGRSASNEIIRSEIALKCSKNGNRK